MPSSSKPSARFLFKSQKCAAPKKLAGQAKLAREKSDGGEQEITLNAWNAISFVKLNEAISSAVDWKQAAER